MRVAAGNEVRASETRVAVMPSVVPLLRRDGHEVLVAAGAGIGVHVADESYAQAGARIVDSPSDLYEQADALFCVHAPAEDKIALLRPGTICIGLLDPLGQPACIATLAHRGVTAYALELVPRISRAQSMDALTSMATLAGYKAVLLAADRLDKLFPLMMMPAGTIAPASVLVLGAGVAGLQAIATAKRLGARVTAFDPRPAVREQVQSLGASFLATEVSEDVETASGYAREQSDAFLQRERTSIADRLAQMDVVICTAQVAGKRAPVLITAEMLRLMRSGAVVVDLAADQGGNCEVTQPGHESEHDGVLVIGAGNLPALVPADASQLYAHNLVNLFRYLYPTGGSSPDISDEIVREVCATRDGQIVNAAVSTALAARQQGVPA